MHKSTTHRNQKLGTPMLASFLTVLDATFLILFAIYLTLKAEKLVRQNKQINFRKAAIQ